MHAIEADKGRAEFGGGIQMLVHRVAQLLDHIFDQQVQQARDRCVVVPEAAGVGPHLQRVRVTSLAQRQYASVASTSGTLRLVAFCASKRNHRE